MGNGIRPTAKVTTGLIAAASVAVLQSLGLETELEAINKVMLVVSYFAGAWLQPETHNRIILFEPDRNDTDV